ncbi:MAG: metallophosphoesterase, partial [Candidatus Faecousia sp.]|nr:metallophosphoesterase [Candidatus Faecousia sp.]
VTSEKLDSGYDVVFLSDVHYGTIQSPEVLRRAVEEINALQPDVVILGGDIVEEGTSKEAMEEAFRVLGNLKSTYGTCYIFGNHDRQRYLPASSRAYTEEELEQAITGNGIEILCDRYITLEEDFVLAGREDVGEVFGRISAGDLLGGADRERFLLVADHQPAGVEENASEGVDLQLSGHTHAGQIFPAGYLIELFGGLNYGLYREGDCQVIVSSGAAGWGFPVRTQGRCEYVVVHLRGTDFP